MDGLALRFRPNWLVVNKEGYRDKCQIIPVLVRLTENDQVEVSKESGKTRRKPDKLGEKKLQLRFKTIEFV